MPNRLLLTKIFYCQQEREVVVETVDPKNPVAVTLTILRALDYHFHEIERMKGGSAEFIFKEAPKFIVCRCRDGSLLPACPHCPISDFETPE